MNNRFQKITNILIPIIFLLIGMSIFCYPMILNPDNMPGEAVDARFVNYILEHYFLFLKQVPTHSSFWDMPTYYPMKNTLALSELLLGVSPIYSLIRLFEKSPLASLQITFAILNILNFSSFFALSKKIFKLNIFYSSLAAFIFAFNLPRYSEIFHIQLFTQFYMILSILFFCLINNQNTKIKNRTYFFLGLFFFVIQTYTTFYFGWFMCFSLPILISAFLIQKNSRTILFNWFKCFDKSYFLIFIFNVLLLIPLTIKYLSVGEHFARHYSIKPISFLVSQSYLDVLFIDLSNYSYIDHMMGIGFVTGIILLISIFKSKYKASILFFIVILSLCFVQPNIHEFLYNHFLPMKAIRAYARFILILVPLYAIIISIFFQKQKQGWLTFFFIILLVFEHIPYSSNYTWTKTEHNEAIQALGFDKSCKIVGMKIPDHLDYFESAYYDINVMWWANENNAYSLNGYAAIYYDILESYAEKKCILKLD